MKTLKKLLIGGSIALASACSYHSIKPALESSNWINVHYDGEIWSSYMGEKIPKSVENWDLYQQYVGLKNGQGNDGFINLDNYKKNTIELPDLDGDGFVISGNRKYHK